MNDNPQTVQFVAKFKKFDRKTWATSVEVVRFAEFEEMVKYFRTGARRRAVKDRLTCGSYVMELTGYGKALCVADPAIAARHEGIEDVKKFDRL